MASDTGLPGYTEGPADSEPITLRKREMPKNEAAHEPEEGADFVQIFVNVGKRDGAAPTDLQRMLTENAGIDRKDTGRIRVRDRNSFVSVRIGDLDKALAAFVGQVFGGRSVIAERARERAE